ncbi:MAG: tRNA pseudouridine synthase A, partial [candidate division Zixibacteria bacterium]
RGRTVQGVLNEKLKIFLKEDIKPLGSGRTDTGVHALSQYANFFTSAAMDTGLIAHKLNRMLPEDIVVLGCREVPLEYNARRDAKRRSYRYLITERLSAVNKGLSWVLGRRLDIDTLNRAAKTVMKGRSFHNFCKVKSRKKENSCNIFTSRWSRYGGFLRYEITADRFLHHMVRLLVGSMVEVSEGREDFSDFTKRFLNVDYKSKHMAPPDGLYLAGVEYEGIKL